MIDAAATDALARQKALEDLCSKYWPPVHAYVGRFINNPEAAQDLTQEFFRRVLEKDLFSRASQDKGKFRTFVLTLLKRFLKDEQCRATAQKRGGTLDKVSVEQILEDSGAEIASSTSSPEEEFDRRWAMTAVDHAMALLRAEATRSGNLRLFEEVQPIFTGGDDQEPLTAIALRNGLGVSALKMRLHRWRQRFRELLSQVVLDTVPRTADLEEEMQHLLGALTR